LILAPRNIAENICGKTYYTRTRQRGAKAEFRQKKATLISFPRSTPLIKMVSLHRNPRSTVIFTTSLILVLDVIHVIVQNQYQIKNIFSYTTRPLWDKYPGPSDVISHFYGEGLNMDANTCQLHGWKERQEKSNSDFKVLDAVLMSNELDLLEIRMNELDSVVDYFLIIESNATFTGLPKKTYFAQDLHRFSKFQHKIVYHL
jgi:beta-1,4-mannosyl-glycoprotein beta-1,4-N-acetylglucosaminyltransferase